MIKLIYPDFWLKNGILSYLLAPLSLVYILLQILRKLFAKPVRLAKTVICVGNVTVGGTGKTQLVLWLAERLNKKKIKFLIITKAYGSNLKGAKLVTKNDLASEVGDESVLLATHGTVLAAKTIKSAISIIQNIKPDVIIFDDGLQNPNFIKDFNILVMDADRALGNGKIMPAGPLREPIELALKRSDIIVTIGNQGHENPKLSSLIKNSKKPSFKSTITLKDTLDLNKQYYAFAAIGNPDRFYQSLRLNGLNVCKTKSFPDHHHYTIDEINDLKHQAKKNNYILITTEKDYIKITHNDSIICTKIELNFDDEAKLQSAILEKILC
jgi:tetraacyldisaccharide 4'-kinase